MPSALALRGAASGLLFHPCSFMRCGRNGAQAGNALHETMTAQNFSVGDMNDRSIRSGNNSGNSAMVARPAF